MVAYSFYESDNRVMRYAEALTSRGDSVDVFALAKRKTLPTEERLSGVKLVRLQMRERNEKGKFNYLSRTLRFLLRSSFALTWRQIFRRYDIIHVHNVPDFLVFAAWFPALTGARVILDIHDLLPEFFASKFSSERSNTKYFNALVRLERISCGFADHVIISNHLWYDKLTQRSVPPRKTSVMLNYVDPEIFSRRQRTRSDDRLIAIFPGGLQEHQGLDIAIRAFSKIIKDFPTAEFHIYGEGNMKEPWMRLARELNVDRHVIFFEPLPIREIVQKVADSDVGLVPKRADSFGNEAYSTKIMEFMSQGIPVVASRTKIDTFYFSDDLITFFNSGDSADLAEKITSVFRDRSVATERVVRSLKHVAENSWAVRKHEYLALIDELVGVKDRAGIRHTSIQTESQTA